MLCQPTLVEIETAPDQCAADVAYYRRVLHELIDMGMDLARLVRQEALAQAETSELAGVSGEATVAFDRISRAIRRSISLARRLDTPLPAPAADPVQRRVAARKQVIRAVEDAIEREAAGGEAEDLHAEFLDRLDSPDVDDDLDHRPVAVIIADICRDLGLAAPAGTNPWKRRTPADIAVLCARAAGVRPGRDAPQWPRAHRPRGP